jgi:hypothetical protein
MENGIISTLARGASVHYLRRLLLESAGLSSETCSVESGFGEPGMAVTQSQSPCLMNRGLILIIPFFVAMAGCDSGRFDLELSSKLSGGTYMEVHPPARVAIYRGDSASFLQLRAIESLKPKIVLSGSEVSQLAEVYISGYSRLENAPDNLEDDAAFFHVLFFYENGKPAYHVITVPRQSNLSYIRSVDLSSSVFGNSEIGSWLKGKVLTEK